MSQPTGLKFCLLPVFPSCLPIFGSVPVLISLLSNYKLITFIVSNLSSPRYLPYICSCLLGSSLLVIVDVTLCVRALNFPIVSLIKYLIPSNLRLHVTLVCAQQRNRDTMFCFFCTEQVLLQIPRLNYGSCRKTMVNLWLSWFKYSNQGWFFFV